jgi:hypothetical protein
MVCGTNHLQDRWFLQDRKLMATQQAYLGTMASTPADDGDSAWMKDASCVGLDTEMFFPDPGIKPEPMLVKLCNGCSVKADCLAYAIKYNMEGHWANTNKRKRERLRAAKSRQKITSLQR